MPVARGRVRSAAVAERAGAWPDGDAVVRLLDVNVLLALLDPFHMQHGPAHDWFAEHGGTWASCAITQNGSLRIMSQRSYTNPVDSPADAAQLLTALCALPGHRFWPCDISLTDEAVVDRSRLIVHAQITDTYLLALAVAHGGRLASFDKRLVADAVIGGRSALELIR